MTTQPEAIAQQGLKQVQALLESEAPHYQVLPVVKQALAAAQAAAAGVNPEATAAVIDVASTPAGKKIITEVETEVEKVVEEVVEEVEAETKKVVEKVTGKKSAPKATTSTEPTATK